MRKSLLYRLFGVGKVPALLKSELNAEGLTLFDDGVKGSVTYRDFSAPGKRFGWRRQWFTGAIGLTKLRLVAVAYSKFIINVPLADERIHKLNYSVENNGAFCVTFDASLFHADWSGTIEYRFRTLEAQRLLELLEAS